MENTELIEKVAHIEDRGKSNTKRLDEHDTRLDNLEKTYSIMENMNYRMGKVETSIEKIDAKLDAKIANTDKEKSKKWDKLIDYLFYTVLGILIAYIAVQLGLK